MISLDNGKTYVSYSVLDEICELNPNIIDRILNNLDEDIIEEIVIEFEKRKQDLVLGDILDEYQSVMRQNIILDLDYTYA